MVEKKPNPHEGHREKLRQRFIRENGFENFFQTELTMIAVFVGIVNKTIIRIGLYVN